MRHILNTIERLSVSPIFVAAGDPYQGQPLDTVNGQTSHVRNIFSCANFLKCFEIFQLIHQHRVLCPVLDSLLAVMRTTYVSNGQLNLINLGPVNV